MKELGANSLAIFYFFFFLKNKTQYNPCVKTLFVFNSNSFRSISQIYKKNSYLCRIASFAYYFVIRLSFPFVSLFAILLICIIYVYAFIRGEAFFSEKSISIPINHVNPHNIYIEDF